MESKRSESRASRGNAAESPTGGENAMPHPAAEMARRNFLKFAGAAPLALSSVIRAQADGPTPNRREFIMEIQQVDVERVAPALEKYTRGPLSDLWRHPGLAPRDRSIVTLAALIARNHTTEMPYQISLAIDNGVKPREISEAITHLEFYSDWKNAMSAVAAAKDVFAARQIGADQLPSASPRFLPLDEAAEAKRAAGVEQQFSKVAPGVVHYTTDLLFREQKRIRRYDPPPFPQARRRRDQPSRNDFGKSKRVSTQTTGAAHGNQKERFAAIDGGSGRLFHRLGAC
jgi:alkylhydroperoxidase/carboxymuconolactone decarboxylase family protein YurZ